MQLCTSGGRPPPPAWHAPEAGAGLRSQPLAGPAFLVLVLWLASRPQAPIHCPQLIGHGLGAPRLACRPLPTAAGLRPPRCACLQTKNWGLQVPPELVDYYAQNGIEHIPMQWGSEWLSLCGRSFYVCPPLASAMWLWLGAMACVAVPLESLRVQKRQSGLALPV